MYIYYKVIPPNDIHKEQKSQTAPFSFLVKVIVYLKQRFKQMFENDFLSIKKFCFSFSFALTLSRNNTCWTFLLPFLFLHLSGHYCCTWKDKEAVCRKTFLKGIVMLRPALMLNGPWALGGRQVPCKGKVYSPPAPEDRLSWPVTSPISWGSKQTSMLVSDPAWAPEVALTRLSPVKSGHSICRTIRRTYDSRLHRRYH